MDAHSRDRNMLHKCNRARRENAASGILSYIAGICVASVVPKRFGIVVNYCSGLPACLWNCYGYYGSASDPWTKLQSAAAHFLQPVFYIGKTDMAVFFIV